MAPTTASERTFIDFAADAGSRCLAAGDDFSVEWIAFDGTGPEVVVDSATEHLLIVGSGVVHVSPITAAAIDVPADSVAIVPAGRHRLRGQPGTRCAVIMTCRAAVQAQPPFRRLQALAAPQVLAFEQIKASPEKPRLKMLQTETLSINIVDYAGPRDRSALSPHSHADFEQGSLAIEGRFVHHLRLPWGSNADLWRDDEHLPAASPSLVVIPPHLIHTTEGVGDGRHLLIDLFSPPRQDFIASGWVFNAGDYRATGSGA